MFAKLIIGCNLILLPIGAIKFTSCQLFTLYLVVLLLTAFRLVSVWHINYQDLYFHNYFYPTVK